MTAGLIVKAINYHFVAHLRDQVKPKRNGTLTWSTGTKTQI